MAAVSGSGLARYGCNHDSPVAVKAFRSTSVRSASGIAGPEADAEPAGVLQPAADQVGLVATVGNRGVVRERHRDRLGPGDQRLGLAAHRE